MYPLPMLRAVLMVQLNSNPLKIMQTPLMIIANLGRVRPVTFKKAGDDPREKAHFHEISDSTQEMNSEKISDVVTDQQGKFPQSGPVGQMEAMSAGENHNLETELEKQSLQRVAGTISDMVAKEGYPAWTLVAPQMILPRLVETLPTKALDCLSNKIPGDFTNAPLKDLEKRFLNGH